MSEMSNKTRTSFSCDKELWREFTLWVFTNHGGRKASNYVELALREYLDKNKEESR